MTDNYSATNLTSYPTYKDSRATWIGEIPEHWRITAVKREYEIQMGKMLQPQAKTKRDVEVPYLKALNVQWYSVQTENAQTMWATQEEIDQLEVLTGDLLVCEGGEGGRAAIVNNIPKGFIIQNALHRVRPRAMSQNWFLLHMMKVISESGWFEAINNKATIAHFTKEKFEALQIPIPSAEEQTAIVRYLDNADQQIQAYIDAKQRRIALLEEYQQAIIHQAVTRGLDPNVKLKPSGVEWLDDVPEHWDISRVKNEFLSLNHRRVPLSSVERGAMTESKYDYYGASGVIDKVDNYLFNDQLLLIAEDGANLLLRNLPLAIIARGKFWVNNHAHILKPKRGNLEFLASIMEGLNYSPWISGAAQPKLTQDRLMSISISVPSKAEQDKVIEDTVAATSNLTQGIEHARRQVKLMEEYRTSLIADVVTGKLDVRKAAAELPDLEPTEIID